MKKITNPNGMKLLKLLHVWGTVLLLLATGLIYNGFTRYGWKRLWIVLKWVATALLIAVSVMGQSAAVVLAVQLAILAAMVVLSVYKWQRL